MNRRFGLLSVLTLLVLSVTLTACLGGLPQQPAPAPQKAAVAVATAPVITPTLAVTATKPLTPTIAASKATTVTAPAVVTATVGVTTTARVTATTGVTTTARVTATTSVTATPAVPAKPAAPVTGTMSPKLQGVIWTLESYGKPDKPVKVLPETSITARSGPMMQSQAQPAAITTMEPMLSARMSFRLAHWPPPARCARSRSCSRSRPTWMRCKLLAPTRSLPTAS